MVPDPALTLLVLAAFALLFFRRIGRFPINRAVTSALGAVLVVALGALTPAEALDSVDWGTILLLFGMLVHVEALSRSGFYAWGATRLVRAAGDARRLALGTLGLAAVCSAVALNDATVLLVTPVLVHAIRSTDVDPVPPILAVVLGANIGSVATPLGNPQNAYVLSRSGLTTAEFVAALAPVALVSLAVAAVAVGLQTEPAPVQGDLPDPEMDRNWALSSGAFLVATFVALLALPVVSPGVVAASLAVVHVAWLQFFRRVPGDEVLHGVDWDVLVLFVGMFVLVGSIRDTVLVRTLGSVGSGPALAGSTFLLSNLVSNVPATILLSSGVTERTGWLLLAAVSTLAGNATPIASAATLIVLDQTARRGVDVSIVRVIALGLPVAVATSALATLVLLR